MQSNPRLEHFCFCFYSHQHFLRQHTPCNHFLFVSLVAESFKRAIRSVDVLTWHNTVPLSIRAFCRIRSSEQQSLPVRIKLKAGPRNQCPPASGHKYPILATCKLHVLASASQEGAPRSGRAAKLAHFDMQALKTLQSLRRVLQREEALCTDTVMHLVI